MDIKQVDLLRYPIGKFSFPIDANQFEIDSWIKDIELLPQQIKNAVQACDEKDFELTYRPSGWNVKQLVNHLVDSHSNSIIRFKLALTEEVPTIKPYDEEAWALLADTDLCPMNLSLDLLANLHQRWVILLHSLNSSSWERKLFHPASQKEFSLFQMLALYAWHGKHHLTHIELAKLSK